MKTNIFLFLIFFTCFDIYFLFLKTTVYFKLEGDSGFIYFFLKVLGDLSNGRECYKKI